MNGKELLQAMDYVQGKYIEEAETATLPKRHLTLRKPLLVAALIAMTMLLVGCAVVYVWKMQNIQVGEQTETKAVLAENGIDILGYEEVNQQVLTLAGLKGSPGYQAAMEWFRFKQDYDPEHILHMQMIEDGTVPEFPAEYGDYNIYSNEMKDKLDEIMDKHGLQPAGAPLGFRTVKNMCAALGVERIQNVENGVTVSVSGGGCRENGNFNLILDFTLPQAPENEFNNTSGTLRWNRKDCFSEDLIAIEDTGDWKEWNYTTASGNEVLIIRSDSDWRGWFLCDRGKAIMSLQIEARRDLGNNDGERTWWDYLYLTDKQMEQIADAIDFGIQPKQVTQADVDNQPAPSNAMTQDGYTLELKQVDTDGEVAYITLGITAPEDMDISKTHPEGHEDVSYSISSANITDRVTPVNVECSGGGMSIMMEDDGDGLKNTHNIVLILRASPQDGSLPFAAGNVWKLRMVDLIRTYYDKEKYAEIEELLAEGEWEFEITFGEGNGDYRELELIQEPVTVNAAGGFYPNGRDADQMVEVTSFILRKYSYSVEYNEENVEYADLSVKNGKFLTVVMEDGTEIQPIGYMGDTYIDLDKVAYVRMVDDTILPAPGRDAAVSQASAEELAAEPGEDGIELLTRPLNYQSLAGYAVGADGVEEPLYETLELTSMKLSASGLTVKGPAVFEAPGTQIKLVMTDGSVVILTPCGGNYGEPMSKLAAETAIDVEKSDYIQLPDGTKVTVPKT